MVYIDFSFYSDTYKGSKLTLDNFDSFATYASAVIDQLTFNRAEPIVIADTDVATITKIQLATCAVADELVRQDAVSAHGKIKSESVGQHSVTYVDDTTKSNTNQERLSRAAKLYLGLTGLMFKGFFDGELGSIPNADEY